MTVFVLISEGLPTPRWEIYLSTADRIFFDGEERHLKTLSQYAQNKNTPISFATPQNPTVILAFWNGTPDRVDELLLSFPRSCKHLFLLTENGNSFEEYTTKFE